MTKETSAIDVVGDAYMELVNAVSEQAVKMCGNNLHLAEAVLSAAHGRVFNVNRVQHTNIVLTSFATRVTPEEGREK